MRLKIKVKWNKTEGTNKKTARKNNFKQNVKLIPPVIKRSENRIKEHCENMYEYNIRIKRAATEATEKYPLLTT